MKFLIEMTSRSFAQFHRKKDFNVLIVAITSLVSSHFLLDEFFHHSNRKFDIVQPVLAVPIAFRTETLEETIFLLPGEASFAFFSLVEFMILSAPRVK